MRRNLTPPKIASQYGVATSKVLDWIRSGELVALNLANRNCQRPRYSITPEALDQFERNRQVIPDGGESTTRKLRRRASQTTKNYF